MKKVMTLMLGMSLVLGTAAVTFAQDPPKKDDTKKDEKDKKGKKGKKKDAEPEKKGGAL